GSGGVVIRWDVNGPLSTDATLQAVADRSTAGKTPDRAGGRTLFATGAEARLTLAPAEEANNFLWLAATDVIVPAATSVEFLGSSRGSFEVWLNGQSLHRRAQARTFQIDSDRFAGTLDAGLNRILVRTGSADAAVEFHLRFRRKSSKLAHEKLTQAALARPGNAARGRSRFFNPEKSLCLNCHQLEQKGQHIGPDLSGLGSRFSRIYIIESILDPNRTIAPSYGAYVALLKNGQTVTGVKVAETETSLTLADDQGRKHEIAKADIANPASVSLMPEGLEQQYTQDEFVDLITFLENLKDTRRP
ncbi:MAG: hypothetical protein ACREH8_18090, partial [Opitutaceae bacterium]